MKIERPDQFGAGGRAARAHGYGESAEALIEEYAPLVRKIAWQVHSRVSRTSDLEDMIQVGLIALIEASRTYEERGFAFATYATTRIRGAMIDQQRREADVGRSAMAAARQLNQTRAMLEQQLRRAPSTAEMAAALDLSPDDYFALEKSATHGRSTSLDELVDEGSFLFADDRTGAGEALEQHDMLDALRLCIARLNGREQMVLQLYFFEELNLQEIGLTLEVSAARVCQIKRDAMAKIDRMMREMTE
ncbi:MAG: FliA/WhiG family RNA polymerase sigma factor [Sphingomonadales bacterium]|nr:FliA/WhiG family RNA polymerase sigma factor [Sphingomonadales bacterium]